MKNIFFYIVLLAIVPIILSAQSYGHQGGGTSFKTVTDTTNNSTGAGKTFWFESSPWIHDGDYYKKLGYYSANGLQEGFGYRLGRATGTNGQILALATGSTPDSTYWTTFTTDSTNLLTRNAGGPYTYMTNTGDNFGIGTNAPATKLHVDGNITITDNDWIGLGSSAGRIEFDDQAADEINFLDSNIGIGYNAPGCLMHLYKASAPQIRISYDGTNYTGAYSATIGVATSAGQFLGGSAIADLCISSPSSGGVSFGTVATSGSAQVERMKISKEGSVVINESGADADFRIESDTDANALVVDGGLNSVGIGTSAPDKKLEINSATGACMRHTYNDNNGSATNYVDYSVSSSGDATIAPSGGDVNVAGDMTAGANGKLTIGSWTSPGYGIIKYSTLSSSNEYAFLQGAAGITYLNAKAGSSIRFALGDTPYGRLESGVFRFGDNTSPAGTYDVEVKDSLHVGGNLLLGAYGGAYSYIHPGSGAWVSSCSADLKNVGQEKNIYNILELIKQIEVREWSFDSSKVYQKFIAPAGYDTLRKAIQDSIREAYEKPAAANAQDIARKKHFTPTAENWYIISQHFGGNTQEINYEQVVWVQFLMIQKLNEKIEALEARVLKLENPK